ncbi:protein LYRIC-like isoform 2-T3 [Pholidichthys leucotaenia]
MEQWQAAASQQLRLLSNRLNEVLSGGLGVDLGLKPDLIPPWLVLLLAGAGLLLTVVLWASVCRAIFSKRRAAGIPEVEEVKRGVGKTVRTEEPKKKKKKAEKKAQLNGRAVSDPQEEGSDETVPHQQPPAEVRADKPAETKKNKKKVKQAVKDTKMVTADGKEPEEGTWETKVSNKEKREQRKKDKSSSDGSASPGGGDTPVITPAEQPKASVALPPAQQKKKKGESTKVKVEKVEHVVPKVNNSDSVEVIDMTIKVPAHTHKVSPWTTNRDPAPLWETGLDESWTVIDRGMPPAEINLVSLAGMGVGTAEAQPVSELQWRSQPRVDDEWSGLNGASVDPSSDWNAPSEAWGNYEEPTPEPPPPQEQTLPESTNVSLLIGAAEDDDDEKDKTATDGASKTKKKKKRKKKSAEEGGTSSQVQELEKEVVPPTQIKKQQPVQENPATVQSVKATAVEPRVERPVKDNISQKPPVTQVPQKPIDGEPTAKQNNLPAPVQNKKLEESQAPRPTKKKKARRET